MALAPIYSEGSAGDFSGGGNSGGGNNGPNPANPALLSSTGGISGSLGALLVPTMLNGKSVICTFDPSNFNTEEDIFIDFRQEVVKDGKKPTVHRVLIVYRNLGPVTLTVSHTAWTEVGFVRQSETRTIGYTNADKQIYTALFSYVCTGERPQLHISRLANQGALSILRIMIPGNMGDGPQE